MTLQLISPKELISNTKNVEVLEREFLKAPQMPCSVSHHFGPGICMREVFLPKGSTIIGHHHNFAHMNIFVTGRITFFGENGPIEMKAPMTFMGKPGRKLAFIHEDTVWINVFATNETDIEKIESIFLTKSQTWLEDNGNREKVKLLTSAVDNNDFLLAIAEFGLKEEKVREISENTNDIIDLPFGSYKIKLGKSKIEGTGVFATADIEPDEIIAPARINFKRTILGRYANHSAFPNAKMHFTKGGDMDLVATRKISGCLGGQDGEEITINYREALKLTLEIGHGGLECQL